MKRLATILLAALIGFAIIIGAAPPANGSPPPQAPCCDGGGAPICQVTIIVPAHQWNSPPCAILPWKYADITTTGCCLGGTSTIAWWYGYTDTRINNIQGLRLYAAHPNYQENLVLTNNSDSSVWYWLRLQG